VLTPSREPEVRQQNRVSSIVQLALGLRRGRDENRVATATATHPVATIVVLTVRDRVTAWVCGPQNPIQ
jgi:hypothetical protein